MRSAVPDRLSLCALAVLALALAIATASAADEPRATATLECARASQPGRVKCEIQVKPAPGTILKWADAVLVSAPPFATPLRARVGSLDATTHEETVWRWTIALAARSRGAGDVEARVRVVTCVHDACTPSQIAVRAALVVGVAGDAGN